MTRSITIEERFCGPPTSGNGGYVCGMIDAHMAFISEVTLRKPPPLNKTLSLHIEAGHGELLDGDILIATARPGAVGFSAPPPPLFSEAEKAAKNYLGFREHPFPTCFVCGPKRSAGDGLHIFAGRVGDSNLFASPWIPDASLAGGQGPVRREFLWAALDCPGAFALMGNHPRTLVLGRMTAEIAAPVYPGEPCVVVAWPTGQEGRKFFCGSAIYDSQRKLCAIAAAVWIELGV